MLSAISSKRAELADLCSRCHVRRLEIFGSASRDEDSTPNDLDFLVEFSELPPATYADPYFKLQKELEELFGLPVDLLTANSIVNPYMRSAIESTRVLLFAA